MNSGTNDTEDTSLTPQLIAQLYEELNQLYELLIDTDHTELRRTRLIRVIDLTVDPTPPSKMKTWWQRITGPAESRKYPHNTKTVRCWEGSRLELANPVRIILIFIDVDNGALYGGSLNRAWFDGDIQLLLQEMSSAEVASLVKEAQKNVRRLKYQINWTPQRPIGRDSH